MSKLSFISDNDLEEAVRYLLDKAVSALESAENKFDKNVIDPFSAIFEMAGFGLTESLWRTNEKTRKAQKTLNNHIGVFHQTILGNVCGWINLGTGQIIDLVSEDRKIIAEIKNKYNTVKGSDRTHLYTVLDKLIMPKTSKYKDYTAYYVEIIPKSPASYNIPFIPSNNSKGEKNALNSLIRRIDGYTFYGLVTGIDDALLQLFNVLPSVISSLQISSFYKPLDAQFLQRFFKTAFGK